MHELPKGRSYNSGPTMMNNEARTALALDEGLRLHTLHAMSRDLGVLVALHVQNCCGNKECIDLYLGAIAEQMADIANELWVDMQARLETMQKEGLDKAQEIAECALARAQKP